jgi:hypothetical protein
MEDDCRKVVVGVIGGAGSLERGALRAEFPANREFNREVVSFWALASALRSTHAAQLTAFSPQRQTMGIQKEQGNFSRHQGIEIP